MEKILRAYLLPSVVFLLVSVLGATSVAAATLKVSSFPSGAHVSIDGISTGKVTPMNISVVEGDHVVTVEIPGSSWSPDTRTVTIVAGNNDLSVTSSLADFDGLPCMRGADAGQVQLAVAANGAISLSCLVATDPGDGGGLAPDAATATSALQFMLRAQNLPTPSACSGSFGLFGTGWCVQASASGFALTPGPISVSGTSAPFSFNSALNVANSLFRVTYQIVGVGGSCNLTVNGPLSVNGTVGFASSTPGGPLTRATLLGTSVNVGGLSTTGCSGAGDLVVDIFDTLQSTLVGHLVNALSAPVCWQSSTNTFTACS